MLAYAAYCAGGESKRIVLKWPQMTALKNIWICIPTLKRPQLLAACLDSLRFIKLPPNAQVSVVLVDNDAEQSAKTVVETLTDFPLPLFYMCCPQRGLARARNVGVEKIIAENGDAILFVDDDMRLPPQYLNLCVEAMRKLAAEAVRGKMRIVEDSGKVQVPRRASLFSRRDMLPGNGVLVAARVFVEFGLRFDVRFMQGFEDGDFFYRAHLCGAKMFLLEDTYFWEYRPQHRMTFTRAEELRRFMEMRQAHVAVRKYRGGWRPALWYILRRGVPLLLQMIGRGVLLPFSPVKNWHKMENCGWRLAGLVRGLWVRLKLED